MSNEGSMQLCCDSQVVVFPFDLAVALKRMKGVGTSAPAKATQVKSKHPMGTAISGKSKQPRESQSSRASQQRQQHQQKQHKAATGPEREHTKYKHDSKTQPKS